MGDRSDERVETIRVKALCAPRKLTSRIVFHENEFESGNCM